MGPMFFQSPLFAMGNSQGLLYAGSASLESPPRLAGTWEQYDDALPIVIRFERLVQVFGQFADAPRSSSYPSLDSINEEDANVAALETEPAQKDPALPQPEA